MSNSLNALAAETRTELNSLLARMRDNVIWTAQEIRLAEWLVSRSRVRQGLTYVEILVPAGRANDKIGYLLYACLERAANTTGQVMELEGYTRSNAHGLKTI